MSSLGLSRGYKPHWLLWAFLCILFHCCGGVELVNADPSSSSIARTQVPLFPPYGTTTASYATNVATAPAITSLPTATTSDMPPKPPTWEELELNCDSLRLKDREGLWNETGADIAMTRFEDFYANNRIINKWKCPECFEMRKEDCASSNPECDGIRSEVNPDHPDEARWDTALGLYLEMNDVVNCDHGAANCPVPHCLESQFTGPGDFVMMAQLSALSAMLSQVFDAVSIARDSVSDANQEFQKVFAPERDYRDHLARTYMTMACIDVAVGVIGAAGSALASVAFNTIMAVLKAKYLEEQVRKTYQEKPDLEGPLGLMADQIQDTIGSMQTEFFGTGRLRADENTTIIMLAELINGPQFTTWRGDSTHQGHNTVLEYAATWSKLLTQQIALFAWETNYDIHDNRRVPFITFASEPCSNVADGLNDPRRVPEIVNSELNEEFDRMQLSIDYDGKCWWLMGASTWHRDFLDIVLDDDKAEKGDHYQELLETVKLWEGSRPWSCQSGTPLEGGTHEKMAETSFPQRMELEDWIIPSIETWKANNFTNHFKSAVTEISFLEKENVRAAGNIAIPVCDYLNHRPKVYFPFPPTATAIVGDDIPGVGCPILGERAWQGYIERDGERKLTNMCNVHVNGDSNVPDRDQRATLGSWAPGACKVLVWHIKAASKQPNRDLNPYDTSMVLVTIRDNIEFDIGNSGKSVLGDKVLRVWNSALPLELLVQVPPNEDDGVVQFWYDDQYWTSESDACEINPGPRDMEGREIICTFRCPQIPNAIAPAATSQHPLPTSAALFSGVPFSYVLNTQTEFRPEPTPQPRIAEYKPGKCFLKVVQFVKFMQVGQPFPLNHYSIHAHLMQRDEDRWLATEHNVLMPAPKNVSVPVYGLTGKLSVAVEEEYLHEENPWDRPLRFSYTPKAGEETVTWWSDWDQCSYDDWKNDRWRVIDCIFDCV